MWGAGLFGLPTFSPDVVRFKISHFMKVTVWKVIIEIFKYLCILICYLKSWLYVVYKWILYNFFIKPDTYQVLIKTWTSTLQESCGIERG